MKKFLALTALALLGGASLNAQTHGTDAFGYTSSSCTYAWKEIAGMTGATKVTGLTDDNSMAGYAPIGFSFRYYWSDYTQVKIGSNGWVAFNNVSNIAHGFPGIPTPGGVADNYLAPFMADLVYQNSSGVPLATAEVWYWSNNVDSFIVEYKNVPFWATGTPGYTGSNTFEVLLTKADSGIKFLYNTMSTSFNNTTGNNDIIVGIENITGNIGLQTYQDALPGSSSTVCYDYPGTVTLAIPDAQPMWNQNNVNGGVFVTNGASTDMSANFKNVGNANITTNIAVTAKLLDASSATVYTNASGLSTGLVFGDDSTLIVGTTPTGLADGNYSFEVSLTNGQDVNPTNNKNTTEMVFVTPGSVQLDYVTGTYSSSSLPDEVIAWSGGAGQGIGVYMEPPSYPFTLSRVDAFILGTVSGNATGFNLKVFDDDAAPGSGTLLGTESVSTPVQNDWNNVTLTTPISITSGGFYIYWEQAGDSSYLGAETLLPMSRRSYEVLGGAWADYRQSDVNEPLIRANGTLAVGVEDELNSASVTVYPNPSNGNVSMRFSLMNGAEVSYFITDMLGRTVVNKNMGFLNAGDQNTGLDLSHLDSGVYFVNVLVNGNKSTQKLVITK